MEYVLDNPKKFGLALKSFSAVPSIINRKLLLITVLWAVVIFAFEHTQKVDIFVALPYIGLVMLGLWVRNTAYIPLAGLGGTLMCFLGTIYTVGQGHSLQVSANQLVAFAGIWVAVGLCLLKKEDEKQLHKAHLELNEKFSELQELKTRLEMQTKQDPLTKLVNRRGVQEEIDREVTRYSRTAKPFSIIVCDIDHFKSVNDTYGHDCGDLVLKEVSRLLKNNCRDTDVISRWGGEEFLLIIPETGIDGALILAQRLRQKVEELALKYGARDLNVTMSFGVTSFCGNENVESCIKVADSGLYEAKKAGRNTVIGKHVA